VFLTNGRPPAPKARSAAAVTCEGGERRRWMLLCGCPLGTFKTAANGTLVARPARMTFAHRGAAGVGSASTGG
jgi:hypothetical protein